MLVTFAKKNAVSMGQRAFNRAAPALVRGMQRAAPCGCVSFSRCGCRKFSSASPAMQKLQKGFESELQYEKENYDTPDAIRQVPTGWTLEDKAGDVNVKIQKELPGDKVAKIEWQLLPPFDASLEGMEGAEGQPDPEMPQGDEVDFTITIEAKDDKGPGMIIFCNTQQGDSHRFTIGNVKSWMTAEERDNPGSYNGPEFEDLEDQLQEAMDEYLGELGIDDKIFDYIEHSATDKEHREYVRWLGNMKKVMVGA